MEHKSAATIQKISRIAKWVINAFIVIFVIATFLLLVIAAAIYLDPSLCPDNYTVIGAVGSMLIAALMMACVIVILALLHRLAKNLGKQPTPFVQENVSIMKEIAAVMFVSFFISNLGNAIITYILSSSGSTFNLDFTGLVSAGIVYFLALIFQYGVELQDESDSFL